MNHWNLNLHHYSTLRKNSAYYLSQQRWSLFPLTQRISTYVYNSLQRLLLMWSPPGTSPDRFPEYLQHASVWTLGSLFVNDFRYICSELTLLQGNGLCLSHLCIPSTKHRKHSVNVLCWISDPCSTESTPGPHIPSPTSHWELAFSFWGRKTQNYILYSHSAFLKIIVETNGYSFKWTLMGKWVK